MPSPYEYNNTEGDCIVRNRLYDLQIYPDNESTIFSPDEPMHQSDKNHQMHSPYGDYREDIPQSDYADCYDNRSIFSADSNQDQSILTAGNHNDDVSDKEDYSYNYHGYVPIFPTISTAFASSRRSLPVSNFVQAPRHNNPTEKEWYSSLLKPFKKFRKLFKSNENKDAEDDNGDDEFKDISSNFYGSVSSLKFSKALDYFDMLY